MLLSRTFAPFFFGSLLSNCGTWFQNLAQSLLIYRVTGSSLAVGAVGLAQFGSVLFLAPIAGSVADRVDRRRLLIWTQLASAVVGAILTAAAATDHASPGAVLLLVGMLGVATAFSTPASNAIVPQLVESSEVARAIALHSVTFNLARAVGPLAGAAVIAQFGIAPAMAVNTLSYVAFATALATLRPRPQPAYSSGRPGFLGGLHLARSINGVARSLVAVIAISFTAEVVTTLSPAFSIDVFGHAESFVGVMIAAFGVGAVTAAVAAGRQADLEARLRQHLLMLGIGIAALGVAPTSAVALFALLIAGFGYLGANTIAAASIQLSIDDSQRGRVMAVWSVAFLGMKPVSALVAGALAELAGARTAAVLMSIPAVATTMWLRRSSPRM